MTVADLTAITLTHRVSDTLVRACASLARSTRDSGNISVEHVVVTQPDGDGNRPNFPPTARELRLNENLHIPAANNLAVEESTSEFIAFLIQIIPKFSWLIDLVASWGLQIFQKLA